MDQNKVILIAVMVVLGIGMYFLPNFLAISTVSITEMKYCSSADDCVPVGCACSCSGCGGFSYEDIVNKKYVDAWYYQQGCRPAEVCLMVCCPPRSVACENNVCVVKEEAPSFRFC